MDESHSKSKDSVLVTGATGTIGSAVLQELHDRDLQAVAVAREGSSLRVPVVTGDFSRPDSPDQILDTLTELDRTFTGVILCAGVDSYISGKNFDSETCHRVLRINTISQLSLVMSMLRRQLICPDEVFQVSLASTTLLSDPVSSGLVYGLTKSALEAGFRFAVEDFPDRLAVRAVRLPFVGTRMQTVIGDPPSPEALPDEPVISPDQAATYLCDPFYETVDPEPGSWQIVEASE